MSIATNDRPLHGMGHNGRYRQKNLTCDGKLAPKKIDLDRQSFTEASAVSQKTSTAREVDCSA